MSKPLDRTVKCPTCKEVLGKWTELRKAYKEGVALLEAHLKKKPSCRPK
jgi:hypothetical protein